ncbi:unnamed protein product [Brassica napus]|uniref:(rape) hypothetical protein n=1 Tax=Brassica napus TaxID=3708 RepID=A0A817BAS1_BRANA|nr:unnamed protein product [Brassica napus]
MTRNGLSKMAAATVLLVIMSIVPAAVAVTYSVGDFNGWTSGVDYTVWLTGDILVPPLRRRLLLYLLPPLPRRLLRPQTCRGLMEHNKPIQGQPRD